MLHRIQKNRVNTIVLLSVKNKTRKASVSLSVQFCQSKSCCIVFEPDQVDHESNKHLTLDVFLLSVCVDLGREKKKIANPPGPVENVSR